MVAASTLSDRLPVEIDSPTRSRWWHPRLPVTFGYLAMLLIVTAAFSAMNEAARSAAVLHVSTNLHNLLHGHFGTLFASAFVIGDTGTALSILPLLGCLLALAELRFGAMQLVRIFLAGHIGATLLVAVGLWVAVLAHWLPRSIGRVEDVGISYGAMALVGALVVVLPRGWRLAWIAVWLFVASDGILVGQTFTNVGHLVALCIGSAAGFGMIRGGRASVRRFTRTEAGLFVAAAIFGFTMLLG